MFKVYFFSLIGFFIIMSRGYSQDSLLIKQDNHLRVFMTLEDTIPQAYTHEDKSLLLYKFRIKKCYYGNYSDKFIYVACNKESLYQFRPTKILGNGYWWVLYKTKDFLEEKPIYRHSGNF